MQPTSHVLAAIDTLEVGGAQYHLLALAGGLASYGYRVTVVTSAGPLRDEFEAEGISVIETDEKPISHRTSTEFTATLVRLARSGAFDLLHTHLHGASIAGSVASAASGVPLVVTQHSLGTWQRAKDRSQQRRVWRVAAAAIAVSQDIQARVERAGNRAHHIPNGVDVRRSSAGGSATESLRARLHIPDNALLVGFVGRLVEDKDPLLFLEAAALIAKSCPDARFVIAGGGPLRPVIAERARLLGLDRVVHFPGFVAHASAPAEIVDVLLLTSRTEGSPLVVLEAMVAGTPVVATATGDIPCQVQHGATGFVVHSRTPEELASRALLLADPHLRERFGRSGQVRVARHFTLQRMVARTAAAYDDVLAATRHLVEASRAPLDARWAILDGAAPAVSM